MTTMLLFLRRSPLRLVILGILFVGAFCLRLYGLGQLPLGFNPPREYHGALLARGFYEWWLTGDLKTIPPDGIIEPPILEILTSVGYLIVGGEHLWIPQVFSTLFWMVGGVFLYLIAKRIVSPNAAVFCLFFYLFVPYGVVASRAFMPDPLMIMLLMTSIFTILRHYEHPSRRRVLVAAVAASLTIFVKPGICLFQVFGVFVSLGIYRGGARRSLTSAHFLVFTVLSILPTALYGLWVTYFVSGFLQRQVSQKVAPQLILGASFWGGWLDSVWVVMGYAALLGALLGMLVLRKGLPRALMIGLWSGYILFGLVFSDHIATVAYYSLQLVPVVALSLGPVADLIMEYLNQTVHGVGQLGWRGYGRVIVIALSTAVLVLSALGNRQAVDWLLADQQQATSYLPMFKKIGEAVNHSYRTIVLFGRDTIQNYSEPNYTYALMYHGHFLGERWPYPTHTEKRQEGTQQTSTQALFRKYMKKHSPEYFVISRGWWNRAETKGLRTYLTENFPMVAHGDNYVVFDLRRGLDTRGEASR
jgi:4-amino-4-deoxy-L-arabinose transferase-like glycosyltransferase